MFVQPLLFAFKVFPIWNMKKPIDNPFFYFFHNIGANLAQIFPQDHTHFDIFAGFQWARFN